jgi:peptide-methionine (S)-S-oxide reductase
MSFETAILAGGCFWASRSCCATATVSSPRAPDTPGGENDHPTYLNHPGHAEAVEIVFYPERISYRDFHEFSFRIHDPTTKNRQATGDRAGR